MDVLQLLNTLRDAGIAGVALGLFYLLLKTQMSKTERAIEDLRKTLYASLSGLDQFTTGVQELNRSVQELVGASRAMLKAFVDRNFEGSTDAIIYVRPTEEESKSSEQPENPWSDSQDR